MTKTIAFLAWLLFLALTIAAVGGAIEIFSAEHIYGSAVFLLVAMLASLHEAGAKKRAARDKEQNVES